MNNYKIVLIGQCNTGKSSIINRYIYDTFDKSISTTIGAAYYKKILNTKPISTALCIWDTSGQQSRYDVLLPMYFKSTHVILIVYDITSKKSFIQVPYYLNKIHMHITEEDPIIILIGNKFDLAEDREVTVQEAQQYAKQNDLLFIECSAYQNYHIKELFDLIIDKLQNVKSIQNNIVVDKQNDNNQCCF